MTNAMNDGDIRDAMSTVPNWELRDGKLHRELTFADFSEALGFLVRVGIEAEKQGHHPEISNVYSSVTLDLTTHDADGMTEKDFTLARAIEALVDA